MSSPSEDISRVRINQRLVVNFKEIDERVRLNLYCTHFIHSISNSTFTVDHLDMDLINALVFVTN